MKVVMVAYWHREGLDIYRVEGNRPVRLASGRPETLEAVRGRGKKVLIVGRDILLHVRKKYPPAPEKKLSQAVAMEIGDMVPLSKPAFHIRIFQSVATHCLVDVWAWESEPCDGIRQVFPFTHVIPEDLAFSSVEPELRVYRRGSLASILAHGAGQFLAGASFSGSGPTGDDMARFLHGLEQNGTIIRKARLYGEFSFALPGIQETRGVQADWPPCVPEVEALDLSAFKVRQAGGLLQKKALLFRIAVYLCIGYALMQYWTLKNYDRTLSDIRQRAGQLDRKAMSLDATRPSEDNSAVAQDIRDKMKAMRSPLKIMNLLAARLPEGAFVNRFVLNGNALELSVSSADSLSTLKALWGLEGVKKISLKGAVLKDKAAKTETCNILIELGG